VSSASFLEYAQLEAIFFKNFSIYTKSSSVGGDILKREPVSFQYSEEFLLEYVLENENIWKLFLRMFTR
jgi:hypothetical protein